MKVHYTEIKTPAAVAEEKEIKIQADHENQLASKLKLIKKEMREMNEKLSLPYKSKYNQNQNVFFKFML